MDGFNSIDDLYKRILPALKSRRKDYIRLGISSISEEDIWECLKNKKWINSVNLTIFDMVNDIMKITAEDIAKYKIEKVEILK